MEEYKYNSYSQNEQLKLLCYSIDNEVYLNYSIFKGFGENPNYNLVLEHLCNTFVNVLKNNEGLNVYLMLNKLSLGDIDKHKDFIYKLVTTMQINFPGKLNVCYIYQSSFIFSQLLKLLSLIIDKKTQNKIKIIN